MVIILNHIVDFIFLSASNMCGLHVCCSNDASEHGAIKPTSVHDTLSVVQALREKRQEYLFAVLFSVFSAFC